VRTLAFILLVAFAAAVILPNDIGTHNLPATKCKCLKSGRHSSITGKVLDWCILPGNQGDLSLTVRMHPIVCRGAPSLARTPLSSPLQI
jgi:hypothetical protein